MSNTPHDITEEFPNDREKITALKTSNGHFARLAEEYNEVNRQIHRIETRVEPASEDVEEELKRKRVRLKDELAQMLAGETKTQNDAHPIVADPSDNPRLRGLGQS